MASQQDQSRTVLPIPDRQYSGLITYDADMDDVPETDR